MNGRNILRFIGLSIISQGALAAALHPVLGTYVGMTGGVTYQASNSHTKTYPLLADLGLPANVKSTLNYGFGGNGSAELGYRWCHFRFEIEGLFNYVPYKSIQVGKYTFKADQSKALSYSGSNYYIAGLVNVLYELYKDESLHNRWAPYVGVGIGYAGIFGQYTLTADLTNPLTGNQTTKSYSSSKNSGAAMAQGIAGLGYFLDDFGTISLDYRYMQSAKYGPFNYMFKDQTINIGFTRAFG